MKRQAVLREIHRAYRPRSYLEIGINTGRSLALSRTRTIAVDPAFKIKSEIHCDLQVVKATSDDFFARHEGLNHFPDRRVDLAFVDGLHLFEFALRDFMNVERHAHWASVIVVDDVLPRNVAEASRDRGTMAAWAGDVFKLTEVLARYRPDLLLLPLDTHPTGLLLVLSADPKNSVLEEKYEEIVAEYVYPDPQRVPDAVLRRKTAVDSASIVYSDIWVELRKARESGLGRETAWEGVRRSIEAAARPATRRGLAPEPARERANAPEPRRSARREREGKGSPPPATTRRMLAGVRRRLQLLRRRLRRLGEPT